MLSILTAFPLLSSCNDNDAPSSKARTHFNSYQVLVKFESASGTNLVQ